MIRRRSLIKKSFLFLLGIGILFPGNPGIHATTKKDRLIFHFIVASDGHYGQENTSYKQNFEKLSGWIKEEKSNKGLDLFIFNGDITHNHPEFLGEVKKYFDNLKVPYLTAKGTYDFADNEFWEKTRGIPENKTFEIGKQAIVICSTSNADGEYTCANAEFLRKSLDKINKKKICLLSCIFPGSIIPMAHWTARKKRVYLAIILI